MLRNVSAIYWSVKDIEVGIATKSKTKQNKTKQKIQSKKQNAKTKTKIKEMLKNNYHIWKYYFGFYNNGSRFIIEICIATHMKDKK